MATLERSITLAVVMIVVLVPLSVGEEPPREKLPLNVFDKDPITGRYWMWWRPFKTVFDRQKVLAIQKQVEAIPIEDAASIDLDAAFGVNQKSAFLFPVLATHREKGTIILKRFLQKYANGGQLDDRWLLVIASLGRIPSPQSQKALEKEFERVLREYDFSKPRIIRGRPVPVPQPDARKAVLDALLACAAGQGSLMATKVEMLCKQVPDLTWLSWTIALEWTQHLMSERALLKMVEDGLNRCDDEDLNKGMNQQNTSDRLRAICEFLSGPKDMWSLTRKLVLQKGICRKKVSEYLLVQYSGIIVLQADYGNGKYPLDKKLVDVFTSTQISTCRALSVCCKILLNCEPSERFPPWEEFLAKHADKLDAKDVSYVRYWVERIRGPKPPGVKDVYKKHKVFGEIKEPGVHLLGFRAAGAIKSAPSFDASTGSRKKIGGRQ